MNTRNRTKRRISVVRGSDNVFKDLGLPNPEEHLAKAKLAFKINSLIENSGMNQTQAAKMLGVDRARISNLSRGLLKEFSMEKLFSFLHKLGQDVDVTIRPKRQKHAAVHVLAA
jgi:predicted XRE-type DNA-binding protein